MRVFIIVYVPRTSVFRGLRLGLSQACIIVRLKPQTDAKAQAVMLILFAS